MTIYRGDDYETPTGCEGECWTDDQDCASAYGDVYEANVDVSGAVEVDGYDHDTNDTPADDPEFRAMHAAAGATWIRYEDEDDQGREMTCYRLVRDIAMAIAETENAW